MNGISRNEAENRMLMEQTSAIGASLAQGKWAPYMEGLRDEYTKAVTACLLENQDVYHKQMLQETVTTPAIATFEKYAFPLIRAVFPNLTATNLCSVQPMMGPASIVFYLAFVYGSTKGSTQRGSVMYGVNAAENVNSTYSSEEVDEETFATGDNQQVTFTGNVSYTPVRPLSFVMTDGTQTITDDGNGHLVGDVNGAGNNTINYTDGAIDVRFAQAPGLDVAITISYSYDSEGSEQIPQVDLLLTSSPVVARPRKLRSRWSLEAAANLKAVHGLDAETELTAVLAEELKFEIDREIISQLYSIADAGPEVTWDKSPGAGVPYSEHKLEFVDKLIEASNQIFKATRRSAGNWVVCGTKVSTIIESLPGFVPVAAPSSMGVVYLGKLQGRWDIYKDPYFEDDKFLVGHKGISFLETGYIYAPYIPLYMTPTVVLDDFIGRKGLGTQYGKKVVNSKFYQKGKVLHA